MDYLNFDLRIDTPDASGYPVRVTQSPDGEASASLQLNLNDPAFRKTLQTLETVRGVGSNLRNVKVIKPAPASVNTFVNEVATARAMGGALFEALFPGEVRSRYRSSLAAA